MGVETFGGEPIDIELPSAVSGQHVVNFNLSVGMPNGKEREPGTNIQAELTLPVHLRYPDPGCDRRGEDCEEYVWVEVSKRCDYVASGMYFGSIFLIIPILPCIFIAFDGFDTG